MSALFRAPATVDFDGLYRDYAPSVYRYTYAVLGNHADAEDVTQQTFMNAYRACAQGTKPRKAENWLLRIAHNEVRRQLRRNQRQAHELQFTEDVAQPHSERSDPSLADVLRALQALPATQRSALVMREFEGRSYAEIAQIMAISQSALEAHIFRARRALAEQLEQAFTCGDAEEALLSRSDRRLPRRVGRRLKEHLQECRACKRFENVHRRYGTVLKGLHLIPIPASLFPLGAKATEAAGLGRAAAAAGGSAGVGGGAAVGAGAGVTLGVTAKIAAVTAAVAVAGGVGYGVSTGRTADPNVDRKVVRAPGVGASRGARGAKNIRSSHAGRGQLGSVRSARADRAQRGPLRSAITPSARKRDEAKSRPMQRAVAGRKSADTREKASRGHKARLVVTATTKPKLRPTGDKSGARTTTIRRKQSTTRRGAPSRRDSTPAPKPKGAGDNVEPKGPSAPVNPMPVEQPPKRRPGTGDSSSNSAHVS
jgi:RNA polymerase sigma factor (sigma-70 family)